MLTLTRLVLIGALLLLSYNLVLARPQEAQVNPDDSSSSTEATTVASADSSSAAAQEAAPATEAPPTDASAAPPADAPTEAPPTEASTDAAEPSSESPVVAKQDDANAAAGSAANGGGYLPPQQPGGAPPAYVPTLINNGASSSAGAASAGGAYNPFAGAGAGSYNPFAGLGGGGAYGGAFNPFQYLFASIYRPQGASYGGSAPYVHHGGGIYINQCTGCANYADANTDELNDETACLGFIEGQSEGDNKQFGETFFTPHELKLKTDILRKKNPSDITPAVLECCYKVFTEKIAKSLQAPKSVNVKQLKYPELEGLEKGKTCKDFVHSFVKLRKGDYPKPSAADIKKAAVMADVSKAAKKKV